MTHVIPAAAMRPRRIALAALVSALLSSVVSMTMSLSTALAVQNNDKAMSPSTTLAPLLATAPDTASAANNFQCKPGEFCLGRLYNLTGGLYQNTISDPNLLDNTWFYYTNPHDNEQLGRVTNNSWSAANKGRLDVIVYDGYGYIGAGACIHAGRGINLPADWRDRISSFRFATRSVCNSYRVLAW